MSRKELNPSHSQNDMQVLPKIKSIKFVSSEFSKMMFSKEMGNKISDIKNKNIETKKELNQTRGNEHEKNNYDINRTPGKRHSASPFSGHHKNNSLNNLNFKKLGNYLKDGSIISPTNSPMLNIKSNPPFKKNEILFSNKEIKESFSVINKNSTPNLPLIISNDLNFSIISSNENVIKNNCLNFRPQINCHPKFYCANCHHCNSSYLSDQPLEKHFNDLKEAHLIIKRGIEFFVDNTDEEKILLDEIFISDKDIKKDGFHLEDFINEYTRHINSRTYYSQCTFLLQAIVDGKIDFENFISSNKIEKLSSSPLFQGKIFRINPDTTQYEIEKDFENMMDDKLKESLKSIFKNSGKIIFNIKILKN